MESETLVIGASVVAKWYLRDEQLLEEADAIFAGWVDNEWATVCPGHFPFEVTADEAFYRQAAAQPDIVWLGNYRRRVR